MNLKEVLSEQGRSQTWLAGRIKYSRPYIGAVIAGRYRGSRHFWQLVSTTLNIPLDEKEMYDDRDSTYTSNGHTVGTNNVRR